MFFIHIYIYFLNFFSTKNAFLTFFLLLFFLALATSMAGPMYNTLLQVSNCVPLIESEAPSLEPRL